MRQEMLSLRKSQEFINSENHELTLKKLIGSFFG